MSEAGDRSMTRYLAEVYIPDAGEFEATTSPVRAAVRSVRYSGTQVRYVRSTFVPEDQACLLLFEAGSPDVVQQVMQRAGLHVTRVVEAIEDALPQRRDTT